MKRLAATLALGLLIALLAGTGVASADHGTDYAKGNVDEGNSKWSFDARASSIGTDAQGRVRQTNEIFDPNLVVTYRVTCLSVTQTFFEARAVVTNIQNGENVSIPRGLILRGSDPGRGSNTADTFQAIPLNIAGDDPGPCPFVAAIPGAPVNEGEVVVHDS
jgi:hypothetical protein